MIPLQACVHFLCTTNTCISNRVIVVEGVTFKKKNIIMSMCIQDDFLRSVCLVLKLQNYFNASFSFQIFHCIYLLKCCAVWLNETLNFFFVPN